MNVMPHAHAEPWACHPSESNTILHERDYFSAIAFATALPSAAPRQLTSATLPSRPIKMNVWDPETLEARQVDGDAELPFDYRQPWNARAEGLVFPKQYEPSASSFLDYLKTTYRLKRTAPETDELFYIFDLSTKVHLGPEPRE